MNKMHVSGVSGVLRIRHHGVDANKMQPMGDGAGRKMTQVSRRDEKKRKCAKRSRRCFFTCHNARLPWVDPSLQRKPQASRLIPLSQQHLHISTKP